ncbi:MAG: endo-polygalacturonase [Spirochaetes bacterium]|nr:endo-polygalacturonase [Spirochaetota bacterium]
MKITSTNNRKAWLQANMRYLIFTLLLSAAIGPLLQAGDAKSPLTVYGPVSELAPSPHYSMRIRENREDAVWKTAFVFMTECKDGFKSLAGWTHSYVNFETAVAVEVEISKADGKAITKAAVHPAAKAKSCEIRGGKAYVILEKPCLVAVDIDGQMDDQDTGKTPTGKYEGPPIHAVSIFLNPSLKEKPQPDGTGVYAVKPGEIPPSEGAWNTLYFLPGVHDIGAGFPVHAGRKYYIPGDAVVYGTFNNTNWSDGSNISIFGHGTLSGARLKHPRDTVPKPARDSLHDPILIAGASSTSVEGITIADSAHHTLMLINGYAPEKPTDIRWVKIFTWRGNGDGINPFANGLVEDCFIRTQDDSLYVNGRGIRRVVLWNDFNGSSFVLSAMPNLYDRTLVVEDCDVIYARAGWHQWGGGRVFNMRGEGGGACGSNVIFRNIRISDPRPTLQQFFINMVCNPPYWKDTRGRKPGDLDGVLFQNISITAPSILGEPDILWGMKDGFIQNVVFDNVTVAGKKILSTGHFKTNEYVQQLQFR